MYLSCMPKRRLTLAVLRTRLTAIVRAVERGERFVVTRSGRPIVELLPAEGVERRLLAAGLHPARMRGPMPRVRPVRLGRGPSLTRTVLDSRD